MVTIDVGEWDINTSHSGLTTGYTYITQANSANDTGTITIIKFRLYAEAVNKSITIIILENVGGTNFTARDYAVITGVSGDAQEVITLNAPGDFTAMNIQSGDYIGSYHDNGVITDRTVIGPAGYWAVGGDQKECENVEFGAQASYEVSMYGEGSTVAVTFIPKVIMIT